jgi:hypothetical protein
MQGGGDRETGRPGEYRELFRTEGETELVAWVDRKV